MNSILRDLDHIIDELTHCHRNYNKKE